MPAEGRFSRLLDSRWLAFYLQRRIMRPSIRNWVSDQIAARRPSRSLPWDGAGSSAASLADDLGTVGLVNLGSRLSAEQCAELRRYFSNLPVRDEYRPDWPTFLPHGPERHPHCHVANHRPEDVLAAPYLLELANDPSILEALRRHFGCDPVISYYTAWWSYPTEIGPQQAENFHRDVDDWRFVKLFVYLTDVGPENGPHLYVRGSARDAKLTEIRRYSDQEVFEAFGRQSVAVQTAGAGQAFLEDTFGLHKGTPVREDTRLLFQVMYSLFPGPYGPKQPVAEFGDRLPDDDRLRAVNRAYLN